MYKILILPEAYRDIEEIFDYTVENWSYNQAVKYVALIDDCINDIAQEKLIGKNYIHSSKDYKTIKTGRHIIFYRFQDKTCIVVRILHEKMDIDNNL
jgi:toxin ParE1/3/4